MIGSDFEFLKYRLSSTLDSAIHYILFSFQVKWEVGAGKVAAWEETAIRDVLI